MEVAGWGVAIGSVGSSVVWDGCCAWRFFNVFVLTTSFTTKINKMACFVFRTQKKKREKGEKRRVLKY